MSDIESPSAAHRLIGEVQPRQPHREIAELLAAAILRARKKGALAPEVTLICNSNEISLGFRADQSVNANPSYKNGVRQ